MSRGIGGRDGGEGTVGRGAGGGKKEGTCFLNVEHFRGAQNFPNEETFGSELFRMWKISLRAEGCRGRGGMRAVEIITRGQVQETKDVKNLVATPKTQSSWWRCRGQDVDRKIQHPRGNNSMSAGFASLIHVSTMALAKLMAMAQEILQEGGCW